MSTARPSYRAALAAPRILRTFLPTLLGRLSLAMSGLALVLHLAQATGSFAVSGLVTAVLGVVNVVATPWRARLVDRHGQLVPLVGLGILHAAGLTAFAFLATAPLPVLLGLSVVTGLSFSPFGATMRVVWSNALPPGPLRTRGLSLDAVAEEVIFSVGPLAAAAVAAWTGAFWTPLVSAVCGLVGTALFVTSPLSRERTGHASTRATLAPRLRSPLRSRVFLPVVVLMMVPGLILGAVELVAPAVGIQSDDTLLSGVILGAFAASSAVGGLIFGHLDVRASLRLRVVVLAAGLLTAAAVGGLMGTTAALIVGLCIAGLFSAPLLITGYLAADELTDPAVQTEASSWINTAVNTGAALGSGLVGLLLEGTTPGIALALAAAVAALVVVVGAPALRR